ncbi:uncharacterized protein [Ptychodera flava]|uniref:uncharacterized protein isoform X1 n=1 Tax=Ptychodera flava TaxID=63121 RepID=UPI00396A76C6
MADGISKMKFNVIDFVRMRKKSTWALDPWRAQFNSVKMASTPQRKRPVGRPKKSESAAKRSRMRRNVGKINIYEEIERWKQVKEDAELSSHAEVARLLLDRYFTTKPKTVPVTSTPGPSSQSKLVEVDKLTTSPGVSEISQESDRRNGSTTLTAMSGVEEIASDQCTNVNVDTDSQRRREKGEGIKKKMLTSFIDPFEVTIDVTIEEDEDFEYESDEEYEPSFTFTLRPKQMKLAEDEDSYSDDNTESAQEEEDDDDDDVDQVTETSQGENVENISRITTEEDVSGLLNDHVCLTYMQQLLVLANAKINSICHVSNCKGAVQVSKEVICSALYLKWACPANHTNFKWCSQPLLNRRLHSGDLITSAAILLSGNNYGKIHLFAKMLNLKIVSKATFHKIQKHYLVPSIDEYWLKHQQNMIDKHKDKNLVVLGDGRMDSPGFCA